MCACTQGGIVGPLSELLNHHVYQDPYSVLGEVIVELGRAETFAIRRATNKTGKQPCEQWNKLAIERK